MINKVKTRIIEKVKNIVKDAKELKDKHIEYKEIPVNYACIFSQSEDEYKDLNDVVKEIGKVIKETLSGNLYQIQPIETVAGDLQLLKIRKPDATRPERGDADFTVPNFEDFKTKYLERNGYKLIPKDGFVMIELIDPKFNVRVYFSNPPLDKQFGLV
jgi:hypothetical protein